MLHSFAIWRAVARLGLVVALLGVGSPAWASGGRFEVTITNLTRGQVISPPVVATHRASFSLFSVGGKPSAGLEALAENGVSADLLEELGSNPQVQAAVAADGPLPPGKSVTLQIKAGRHASRISVAGMLVSTNDAFFAINGQRLPWVSSSTDAEVYDAGSEANTESCDDVPGPPCGAAFSDPDSEPEGFIHIHNGVHGVADLDTQSFDWRSAGARVVIRRMR